MRSESEIRAAVAMLDTLARSSISAVISNPAFPQLTPQLKEVLMELTASALAKAASDALQWALGRDDNAFARAFFGNTTHVSKPN